MLLHACPALPASSSAPACGLRQHPAEPRLLPAAPPQVLQHTQLPLLQAYPRGRRCARHTRHVAHAADGDPPPPKKEDPEPSAPSTSAPTPSSEGEQPLAVLPGEDASLRIPKEVIEKLKFTVFGYDTFWVTSVDNYEQDGIIFKGNVRGKDPSQTYAKLTERLKAELGSQYSLFLLTDREDKPTVVVMPEGAGTERISRFTEGWVAATFAVATLLSVFSANQFPILQFLLFPFETSLSSQDLYEALPASLAFIAALAAHEVGHWRVAQRCGVAMYLPFVVPAGLGFVGSLGGITRLKGFLPDRQALLEFASQGPLLGGGVSLGLLVLGLVLSSLGLSDIGVDAAALDDSFLVFVASHIFLGDQLANQGEPLLQVNSLVLAGWAGLIVNALACIPAGESDGGRIAMALWGRRTGTALGIWSAGLLTLGSFSSSVAFFYLLLLLTTQRGPVLPCRQELGEPKDEAAVTRGILLLTLPVLVLLPFPADLVAGLASLPAKLASPMPLVY